MGQEFFVKSENLESKVRQLLPSQGGLGAGFDLSASTQIIPIVDLTESAEGSQVPAYLQQALSLNRVTNFRATNTTLTNIITTTGYYKLDFVSTILTATTERQNSLEITDGVTTKDVFDHTIRRGTDIMSTVARTINIFLAAGDSLQAYAQDVECFITGTAVQIADIDGNLTTVT